MVTCIDVKVHLRLCTFRFVQLRKYSPNSRCRPASCLLAVFAIRPLSAVVLTLETSEVSAILVFTTKTTQSRPQVFSVNGALICRRLHF